ncbi:sulfurtransferase complex subunit TusD [Vibrio sp. LaRot3]|uniref:sulfurtransferase complex subunit TusD n=1 Tax=Vibrio sp. LaRot3 TaxID=2998829 RepID=UPI0022CE1CA1|nr:sulfurtransferase complex subunit TusD [Vibrio sp. LaRot3]MDA0150510.1 sulfurtransferase complex subunit TusD [Vibrio sp. LaRot3]
MASGSESLRYSLVVNSSVYGSQSARSAYQFADALIEKGHTLVSVFFYQDGVTNGTALSVPANDEFDLTKAWQQLAEKHNVRLETCVAAALRRGIVSEDEAKQHGLAQSNLAQGFHQAGLGSLAEAMLTQDRVVQF